MEKAVLGLFTYVDELIDAAKRLRGSGFEITIFSPIPINHELEHEFGEKPNYTKYLAFLGALGGFIFGLILTLGTAAMYVLPRGGRSIWPATPTLLMSYETTILLGVVFSLIGFGLFARLPDFRKKIYDTEITEDAFCILIEDPQGRQQEAEQLLKEYGANEVKTLDE
ncbi:MAG: DUF3341 domain-containing protein [Thermodesulfobacteriota bacterium]